MAGLLPWLPLWRSTSKQTLETGLEENAEKFALEKKIIREILDMDSDLRSLD